MAQSKVITLKKPRRVVERNIALLDSLMHYILAEPQVLDSLPEKFELVILPEDDPEMCLYNLKLLNRFGSEGKPVVFVRMKSSEKVDWTRARPSLYVPLAA
ncbi:hypothetical protein ANRL1_01478 [Anaerolineae bacterium]|nr:hypothetical protein ANRL1_01478 [Anaerolineae bacterium]